MAIDFSVELCGGSEDIHVRTRGLATLTDLRAFTRALIELPEFRPGVLLLVDHRDVDFSSFTSNDARSRVEDAVLLGEMFGGARIAIVLGSTADYGIHRMMELIAGDRYTFKTCAFTDLDEAHAWLAQERDR
jgi:hypothetical protein